MDVPPVEQHIGTSDHRHPGSQTGTKLSSMTSNRLYYYVCMKMMSRLTQLRRTLEMFGEITMYIYVTPVHAQQCFLRCWSECRTPLPDLLQVPGTTALTVCRSWCSTEIWSSRLRCRPPRICTHSARGLFPKSYPMIRKLSVSYDLYLREVGTDAERHSTLLNTPSYPILLKQPLPISSTLLHPHKAIHRLKSSYKILSIFSTPACPLYAKPQIAGRPTQTHCAPRACAMKISLPRRIPPSMCT